MTEKVLARGSNRNGDVFAVLALGCVAVISSIWLFLNRDDAISIVVLTAGLLVIAAGLGVYLYRRANRLWLLDEGHAVVLSNGSREWLIDDDQVVSAHVNYKCNYSNGRSVGVTRALVLWQDQEGEPAKRWVLRTRFKEGKSDPIADYLARIQAVVDHRARQELAAGSVTREHWTLSPTTLSLHKKNRVVDYALSEIAAVGVAETEIRIWKVGEEFHSDALPETQRDALLCGVLLGELLEARGTPATTPQQPDFLGRIIVRRGSSRLNVWVLMIAFVLVGLVAITIVVAGVMHRPPEVPMILVGVALLVGAGVFLLAALASIRSEIRFHELGVARIGFIAPLLRYRYSDLEGFSERKISMYYNGAYTGTSIVMKFFPHRSAGVKPIKWSTTIRNGDEALQNAVEFIGRSMAAVWHQELLAGNELDWTPKHRFLQTGLEVQQTGTFGTNKQRVVIPYGEIDQYQFVEGQLRLFRTGQKKRFTQVESSVLNFHPGMYLLFNLIGLVRTLENIQGNTGDDDMAGEPEHEIENVSE